MFTILSFRIIENKHDVYRGKEYLKRLCEYVRTSTMKIISFENKKIKLLTKEEQKLYKNAKKMLYLSRKLKKISER